MCVRKCRAAAKTIYLRGKMDPAAQNDNYESFLERDRMARSTSISSKVNFAGAGGGVDDNNSLGTTSIGKWRPR